MHVLQVTARYHPELQFGGPPRKIHALSRGLIRRGHQVQVVTLHSGNRSARKAVIDGVAVENLRWVGRGAWQVPIGIRALSNAVQRAEVIHCYGLYNLLCPVVASLAGRAGRPFVLEPLGMYVPRARSLRAKRLYHHLFTSWMGRRAARIVATSPGELEELSALAEPGRLVLRRNGIDLEEFQCLPPRGAFRSAYRVLDNERLILYIGRISPIKNLEQLVQAYHELAPEGTRLILAGPMLEPDYARRLGTLVAELGLIDQVSLVGPLYGQDKLAALAAADLFVLPSLFESYGNAAAEAAAAGVPVLLTEGCGIAQKIHGRAGLAVPATVSGLADGLRIMLYDADQRVRLVARRDEIRSELSWEEPLAQMEQLYADLVGSGPDASALSGYPPLTSLGPS